MIDAQGLLLELTELAREIRMAVSEGVPGAMPALNHAEQLREEASQAIHAGRRNERDRRDQEARRARRQDLVERLAAINTRLDEIDLLLP